MSGKKLSKAEMKEKEAKKHMKEVMKPVWNLADKYAQLEAMIKAVPETIAKAEAFAKEHQLVFSASDVISHGDTDYDEDDYDEFDDDYCEGEAEYYGDDEGSTVIW